MGRGAGEGPRPRLRADRELNEAAVQPRLKVLQVERSRAVREVPVQGCGRASPSLRAATLSVRAIGEGYAEVARNKPRFGVKQVDRVLSNTAIDVARLTPSWARFVVGARKEIVIALEWTDFDKDDHTTLCAYLVTSHGRATALAWKTVKKSSLAPTRHDRERDSHEGRDGEVIVASRGRYVMGPSSQVTSAASTNRAAVSTAPGRRTSHNRQEPLGGGREVLLGPAASPRSARSPPPSRWSPARGRLARSRRGHCRRTLRQRTRPARSRARDRVPHGWLIGSPGHLGARRESVLLHELRKARPLQAEERRRVRDVAVGLRERACDAVALDLSLDGG